jgi:hypothetical protein
MGSNHESTPPEGVPPPIPDISSLSPTLAAMIAEDFASISPDAVANLSEGFEPDPAPFTPAGAAPEPYEMIRGGTKRGASPPSPTPVSKKRRNTVVPELGEALFEDMTPGEGTLSVFQYHGESDEDVNFGEGTVGDLFEGSMFHEMTPGEGASSVFQPYGESDEDINFGEGTAGYLFEGSMFPDMTPGEDASSVFQRYGESDEDVVFGEGTVGELFEEPPAVFQDMTPGEGASSEIQGYGESDVDADFERDSSHSTEDCIVVSVPPHLLIDNSSSAPLQQPRTQQPTNSGTLRPKITCAYKIPAQKGRKARDCNNQFYPATMDQTYCYAHRIHQPARATRSSGGQLNRGTSSAPGNLRCAWVFPSHQGPTELGGDRCKRVFRPARMGQTFCFVHDKRH